MEAVHPFWIFSSVMPIVLMLFAVAQVHLVRQSIAEHWRSFKQFSYIGLGFSILSLIGSAFAGGTDLWIRISPLSALLAVLVQFLATVITSFSARYLEGELNQKAYLKALGGVLASVHLLLLADHWVVLISAWALVGLSLHPLLCFYSERPFARLAAHKKRLADRLADLLLVIAALLAWVQVGSGSLSELWRYVEEQGITPTLQLSAVLLVIAVIMRTALLPVHGWLIQVMEAPTPVSALLHAGVVNLGGFVLITFAPLLQSAMPARTILVIFGLATAALAGLVMLTRISIKVRLAWSTVAQMGFMVLECGLGLYTLAALHLLGHSLYKAHTFLTASTVVRETRMQMMRGNLPLSGLSLWLAPLLAGGIVSGLLSLISPHAWPWWWSWLMGMAWAPLLWMTLAPDLSLVRLLRGLVTGVAIIIGLTLIALIAHALPLQLIEAPDNGLGLLALVGMTGLYLSLVLLHIRPGVLEIWRRWSYAGFYIDEYYTRITLRLWPTRWTCSDNSSENGR